MKRVWGVVGAAVLMTAWMGPARAVDYYWTNGGTAGNFANVANWGPAYDTVPGSEDNANFTNAGKPTVNWTAGAANANAFFDTTNNTTTLAIGADNAWLVTNSFILGQNAGKTSSVTQTSGSLVVSNDSGTARLTIGQAGRGTYTLSSGTLFVNQLLATNNAPYAQTNSTFNFNGGTLVTRSAPDQIAAHIAVQSNQTFSSAGNYDIKGSWAMLGGTNIVNMLYVNTGLVKGYLYIGGGSSANNRITVGSNAAWNVVSGIPNFQTTNNTLAIINGGKASLQTVVFGSSNNTLLVTDPGSSCTITGALSFAGSAHSIIVSNGGTVSSAGGTVADGGSILITGAGSFMTSAGGSLAIGRQSSSNSVTISDGGTLVVPSTSVGGGGAGVYTGNTLTVTGPGASMTNLTGGLTLGDSGTKINSQVVISNGGRLANLAGATTIGTGGNGGRSNSVLVSGAGSVLTNSGTLIVGNAANATFGSLSILDMGLVSSTGATIGASGSSFNSIAMQNGGRWDLRNGTLAWGGGTASNNTITADSNSVITNVAGLSLNDSGRTVYLTNQTLNGMNVAFSGGALNIGTGPNLAPSALVMRDYTLNRAGSAGGGASLIGNACFNIAVSVLSGSLWNGGNQALTIGSGTKGTNNVLLIDGQGVAGGAVVTNMNATVVGSAAGSGWNSLMITNGGRLFSGGGTHIIGNTSPSNTVVVSGGGALWNLGGQNLTINPYNAMVVDGQGVAGGAVATNMAQPLLNTCTLLVTNGGRFVCNTSLTIGNGVSNTTVRVVGGGPGGANAVLCTPGFSIAYAAPVANDVLIIDGAGVEGGAIVSTASGGGISLTVGAASTSHDNAVIVTNKGRLYLAGGAAMPVVGYSTNNLLLVADGGKVFLGGGNSLIIGYQSNASGNGVIVRGAGSLLDFGGGAAGATIGSGAGGAQPVNQRLTGNYMLVDDSGVVSNGAFAMSTISNAYNSSLMITNGGKWYAGSSTLAFSFGGARATGNVVTVTGSGSLLDLAGMALPVGANNNTNNWLTIDQGGAVENIGTLTVAGAGNAVNLLGGTLGAANTVYTNGLFTVGDGAQVATLKSLAGGMLTFNNGLLVAANGTLAGLGTVSGAGAGLLVTNGAFFNPGLNGAGTLTVGGSNLTWAGGGVYRCEITNMTLGFGAGWDVLNVSSQLVFAGGSPKFVIRLDSRGAPAAGFDTNKNYTLKILSYGGMTGYDTNQIDIDATSAFEPAGLSWSLLDTNNALWLVYKGTDPNGDSTGVWNVPASGNWSVDGNWLGGVAPAAGGSATHVLSFGDNGTPYNSSNNLAGTFTLNKLQLSNISGVTNVIRGNALSFAANGAVAPRVEYQTGAGSFVMSNALVLADGTVFGGEGAGTLVLASNVTGGQALIKEGPWTLALAAANQFADPVLVTNAGVVRLDHNLALGTNSVAVTDGGVLKSTVALTLGNGGLVRQARVAGAGSWWTNTAAMTVGSNAQVTVADGGVLVTRGFTLENSAGAVPCGLLITNGGVLTASNAFNLGTASSGNKMLITGNGSLFMGPGDVIAGGSWPAMGAAGNQGNTLWIENGGTFTNARFSLVGTNSLVVTNGGRFFCTSLVVNDKCMVSVIGGTGVTTILNDNRGGVGLTGSGEKLVVDGVGADGSAVLVPITLAVSGNGSRARVMRKGLLAPTTAGSTIGGVGTSNNGLEVVQGGYAKFPAGPNSAGTGIGKGNQANNNYVLVEDAGSVLEITVAGQRWDIGYEGYPTTTNYGNRLLVRNGGMLTNAGILSIAGFVNGGEKSTNCFNNGILVSATGQVYSSGPCQLAWNGGVTGNYVKITDTGSYWSMGRQSFTIGNPNALGLSTNNYLMVDQGAILENVGNLVVYSNNQAYLLGGMLGLVNAGVSNGLPFVAGDGAQEAVLKAQNGTLNFPAGLVVTNKAVLGGSGVVVAPCTVQGVVSPGLSGLGALTNNGAFSLLGGSESRFDVVTNAAAGCDLLAVTNGTLTLAGTLKPVLADGFIPAQTDRFLIMTNQNGSVAGGFANGGLATIYAADLKTRMGTFAIETGDHGVVLTGYRVWHSGSTVIVVY